ncbi:MAG: M64 family metallo-endopeptidase [Bacteroidales bacterium]|nr:M64 family metallo-endopeptidase [Bacteroidales bacterium]
MTKTLNITSIFLFVLLLTGCVKDPPPVLTPSAMQVDVPNMQATGTLTITSNAKWTAQATGSWFTISPSSGVGDGVITITAQNNVTNYSRTGSIILTTGVSGNTNYLRKIVTVNQSFSQLSVDYDNVSFEKDAGSKIVKVTANTPWTLQIPSSASWLSVNTASGSTSGDLTFTVQANTAGDRTAKVTFTYGDTTKVINMLQKRAVNASPTAVQALTPVNLSVNNSRLIACTWTPSTDTDNDRITYTFEVSDNAGFLSGDGKLLKTIATDSIPKAIIPELLKENTKFYWRVTAADAYSGKSVSQIFTFTTGTNGGYTDGEYRVAFNNVSGANPNEIIFLGDGYTVEDYVDGGKFDQDMTTGINAFFNVEPYKSYKSYFKVYKVAAYSQDSGVTQLDKSIAKKTAFNTVFKGGSSMDADEFIVFKYAAKVPGMEWTNSYATEANQISGKLQNTLVVLVVNQDRYAGTNWSWSDGKAISICPVSTSTKAGINFKNVINHEAGGHGFGRLADEYISSENSGKTIPEDSKTNFKAWVTYGFYPNVDVTNDQLLLRWKHFLGKTGYDAVGAFEGALYYSLGAWKPESSSCMVYNEPYYNAPSRENIVKRILRTAAGTRVIEYVNTVYTPIPNDPYSFDAFVAKDIQKSPSGAAMLLTKSVNPLTFVPLAPPVMIRVY